MKIKTYIIFGVILILATGILLACKPKNESADNQKSNQTEDKSEQQENPFNSLRQMALSVTPEQLRLESSDETKVFAIVMDWDLGTGIATIAAYKTGDASMYLSSGGGVIGGGQHENVRQSVFTYVQLGQEFLSKSKKTESTPLPDKDSVRFYLLTNKGTYYAQEEMKNIENESSDWLRLFEEANKVLAELRKTTEEK